MRAVVFLLLLLATVKAGKPIVVNNGAICENKATGFFVIDNMVLTTADSMVYNDYSEDECLKTCSQNRDQLGRSILCSSFVYNHESFTCTVYKDKKVPEGKAKSEVAIGKRYFEKVCLADEVPINCADSQFLRVDNFELIGYAIEVSVTESLEECLATCAKNSTCKSALYFYEERECILNTESGLTKSEDFKKAQDDDKVIYFQNACASPHIQIDPTTPVMKSDKVGSTDEIEKKSQTSAEVDEITEVPTTEKALDETIHNEREDHEIDHEVEKVEGDHEPSTVEDEDDEEYENEDEQLEEEEEELEKEKVKAEKLPAEKASYLKYKEHPKNFGSRTLQANDDEVVQSTDEHTASHQQGDQEEIEQVSKEGNGEPTEIQETFIKKESKEGKKIKKFDLTEEKVEEPYTNYFSEWSDWTPCTKSGERQIRRRKCLDLRKCLGALMQVQNCPAILPTPPPEDPIESVRSLVEVPSVDYDDTEIRSPVTLVRPSSNSPILSVGDTNPEAVWSPWAAKCQQFASGQPCNDGQMIGFESRECIAKDPSYCEGPFFRYCTLVC